MNKKPGLLFAVCIFAVIILAASFNMNLGGADAVQLRPGVNPDDVLYVCPLVKGNWDTFATALGMWRKYMYMGFVFAMIVLTFSWSWALYQNLLKDKFSDDVYKNPWGLTKVFFWAMVICTVLALTPNHFRVVNIRINGHDTNWVLCENNSEGAKAVNATAVKLR